MESTEFLKIKKNQIWLWCIIIVLVFWIIVLFSLSHYSSDELAKLFTFASTISSIILSVIAIIMTVVSGESVNSLLHKFRDLHNEIKDEPQKINTSVEGVTSAATELHASMATVNSTITKIDNSVSDMSDASTELDQAVKQLKELVEGIDNSIIDINSKVSNIDKKMNEGLDFQADPKLEVDKNKIIPLYLSHSSYSGLCMLYCICLAHKEHKLLNLSNFSKLFASATSQGYFQGYFVSSAALGLFTFTKVSKFNYHILNLAPGFENMLSVEFEKKNRSGKFPKDYTIEIVNFVKDSTSALSEPASLGDENLK